MKNGLVRKGLVCGIIMLFVGASVVSALNINPANESKPMNRGNWLYVGGSGPGNYTHIQDAINASSAGDTVFVYSGTYLETYLYGGCDLAIIKSINVVGENKETTIIYGGNSYPYNCIAIESNGGVEFSGFTINNSFLEFYQCSNSIVHDVILNMDAAYNSRCVYIQYYSDNNIFYDNIFNNAEKPVWIRFDAGAGNLFYHNNFFNNTNPPYDYSSGIYFYNTTLKEGNYYDDYIGEDNNGDGIGDTPYNISGGSNQDLYPFMYPNGWIPPSYVWVDDNFTSSTPGWGYDHFNHIQYGINAVSEHGMVYVFNGTYTEELEYLQYVRIQKSLSLIGENKETTIIDCPEGESGVVIWAGVNHVNISGFTVKGYNLESIGIYGNHDNNDIIIENCIVHSFFDGISLVVGTNSQVRNCITYDNSRAGGIDIAGGNNHTIIDCTSYDNSYGIRVENSNSCIIYHNNLFNNTANAYDDGTNTWNDSYPSGGNYWSDYTGVDNNHGPNQSIPGPDGIGDTPYDFPCEHAIDWYPFMEPNGWLNNPPDAPTIDGNAKGRPGNIYQYTVVTIDPEGDNVYYCWGDGTNTSPWDGPYGSGEEIIFFDCWNKMGTYTIKVKAKDIYGAESDWGYLEVIIPRTYTPLILRLLERFPHAFPMLRKLLVHYEILA